jgi:hypothetical protein
MSELRLPSYQSLWMLKHGRPDQIRVDFRQTAAGGVNWVILTVLAPYRDRERDGGLLVPPNTTLTSHRDLIVR